jgi:hypothetical protein
VQEDREHSVRRLVALVVVAAVLFAAVAAAGWYQWSHRAASPIDLVKEHRSEATGATIGAGIDSYLRSEGTEIVEEGFKPTWGAEEMEDGGFVVAYVYEVGRDSRWVSWRVDPGSGEVEPLDRAARELWR